jgi:very-short-patch-repair endonuclease
MVENLNGISDERQLRAGGLGKHAVATRIARGEIQRVRRGTYRHVVRGPDEQQLATIALMAVKGRGVITGAAGLRALGFAVTVRRAIVDVAVPHGSHVPTDVEGAWYRRSSHLDRVRATDCEGNAVAQDWWCMGDLAYDVTDAALAEVIAAAIGSRRIDLDRLEFGLAVRGRFPGRARLRRVIAALRSDLPFSRSEADAAVRLRRAGVAVEVQHSVAVDGGRRHLLDLCIPELRLDIEIDGPHHWLPGQATADRTRDRELRAAGWAVERFSVYEIDRDPEAFVVRVLEIIERRRRELRVQAA